MKKYSLGIVGATGAVGQECLKILETKKDPKWKEIRLFASARSKGKSYHFLDQTLTVEELTENSFSGLDFVFFDASDEVSKKYAPLAVKAGCMVVDQSAAFRMDDEVDLLVPEVNGKKVLEKIKKNPKGMLFSGPNCTTIPLVMVLDAIQKKFGLKKVVVSTYQSSSGAGAKGAIELVEATKAFVGQKEFKPEVFAKDLSFNCIPQIGGLDENGYSSEELKMMRESKKILGLPGLALMTTSIRVPTLRGHAETVWIETEKDCSRLEVEKCLDEYPGVLVVSDQELKSSRLPYPDQKSVANQTEVLVSRVRKDPDSRAIMLWLVSDNLWKGAAQNGIQIAEMIRDSE